MWLKRLIKTKWLTRERVKMDQVACPLFIKMFLNPWQSSCSS
jgi:hypothetical protein